jgi:hypothetical protein
LDNQALSTIPLSDVNASANVLSEERIYDPLHRDHVDVLPMLGRGEGAAKEKSCQQAQSYESQTSIYMGFASL